jgi:hypothetical protein
LHASSATVTITPGVARATVELRVFTQDFPTGDDSAAVLRYLRERFRLFAVGRTLEIALDGQRSEGDTRILALSFAAPARCEAIRIWHGLLLERFTDQVNLVQIRCGQRTSHLIFTRDEGPKGL